MKRQQPERQEQAAIVQLLKTIGAAVYVLGTTRRKGDHPGTMQTPGLPDLYAFLPWPNVIPRTSCGTLWIEVKAPKGKLSLSQRAFRIHCEAAKQWHLVGGLDAVMVFLKTGGWTK